MRFCLLLVPLLLSACASRHSSAGEIEPEGLVIERNAGFHVRVEGLEEHALYVRQLEQEVAEELVLAGWRHEKNAGAGLDVLIEMDRLEEGDERGTLAECQVTVYLTRGGETWRFEARGDSAGRWKEDRVPTAISNAARAVVQRLLEAQN